MGRLWLCRYRHQASSSSADLWACAGAAPAVVHGPGIAPAGCVEGGAAARCRHCAQPGWVLSSTRHKPPAGFQSRVVRRADHAAFALGCRPPSSISSSSALQAEEHLEVIVAVAAGRGP